MWVCRPGKHGKDYELVKKYGDVFLGWTGYHADFHGINTMEAFKEIVVAEKDPSAATTISTWAGQLYSFCCVMKSDDFVLIPDANSRNFMLAVIDGDYRYEKERQYPHVRSIRILYEGISRSSFSQATQYSLGAYRTIFKVKQENEVINVAKAIYKVNGI